MNTNVNYRCQHPQKYGKVAVLMGGWSAEREISLKSGSAVLEALTRQAVDCVGIDLQLDKVCQQLGSSDFSIAFNMLHGRGGEDGLVQAVLEILKIPYTGSNILASSLTMDKEKSKLVMLGAGLPTPKFLLIEGSSENINLDNESIIASLGLPLVVKPVLEGSSVGMSIVHHSEDLQAAIVKAFKYDCDVLLESFIKGIEYTISIVGDEVLPVIRVETPREFYDYAAKYEVNDTKFLCPCGLDEEKESQLKQLAHAVFKTLGARGWGRVDLFVDDNNKPWIIELNTVPGMTDHSLVPIAAKAKGIGFDELVIRILDEVSIMKSAKRRILMTLHDRQAVKSFSSNKAISVNPGIVKLIVALFLLVAILGLYINMQTQEYLPIKKIHAQGVFEHVSEKMILNAVSKELNAGYINLDVTKLQHDVEQLQWVKSASIRRVWPDTIVVSIVEQHAEVIWALGGLLNSAGEKFIPEKKTYPKNLPIISGSETLNIQAMSIYYTFQKQLSRIGLRILYFQFDDRRSIQMKLNNSMTLVLGREHYQTRLQRFINIYKSELENLVHKIQRIDMRYTNGFSIKWKINETGILSGLLQEMKHV